MHRLVSSVLFSILYMIFPGCLYTSPASRPASRTSTFGNSRRVSKQNRALSTSFGVESKETRQRDLCFTQIETKRPMLHPALALLGLLLATFYLPDDPVFPGLAFLLPAGDKCGCSCCVFLRLRRRKRTIYPSRHGRSKVRAYKNYIRKRGSTAEMAGPTFIPRIKSLFV